MVSGTQQLVAATVATLAPYIPFLIDLTKAGSQKFAEVIAEKGGEAAWHRAQALWSKLKSYFEGDAEVISAATLVAAKPEDVARQKMLAEVLSVRLKQNPELAQELLNLLGGQEALQKVLADRSSWVEDITQDLEGSGKQIVQASEDSVVKGVKQTKR